MKKDAKKVSLQTPGSAEASPIPDIHNWADPTRTADQKRHAAQVVNEGMIRFRSYQKEVFLDRKTGLLVLHWSRQIGKSFTLAAWAVDRLLSQLQTHDSWLITVLSNSKDNGGEFCIKCAEVCNKLGIALSTTSVPQTVGDAAVYVVDDHSPDLRYENMRMEIRITMGRKTGRIKVLAANPRTARGFSGDLILDEFGFHEDSPAIWDASEPILSANQEYLCRIASTGNGKHNMFYLMASGSGPSDGTFFKSANGYTVSRVTRSAAHRAGVKIYDLKTRDAITPDQARARAASKRSYDQNYECAFMDENMALLTMELIMSAEREGVTIDSQAWSRQSVQRMLEATGRLEVGWDFGRNRDLSVITVIERDGRKRRIIAMLRMEAMRTPDQNRQLDVACGMPQFGAAEIDMTGNGTGATDYAQEKWGTWKVRGVHFASTEPINERMRLEGRKAEKARVTELMASDLLDVFEERSIEIPLDMELRDDLQKPEQITSPGGRVSIAATRDEAGHADHFWSIALAVRAGKKSSGPIAYSRATGLRPTAGTLGMGRASREVYL